MNEQKLYEALKKGPIHAHASGVYDIDGNYLGTTTQLQKLANNFGLVRTDSGGSPTWTKGKP